VCRVFGLEIFRRFPREESIKRITCPGGSQYHDIGILLDIDEKKRSPQTKNDKYKLNSQLKFIN